MRMGIVGQNPRSGGCECIVFGYVGRRDDRFAPIGLTMRDGAARSEELSAFGDWDVRPMRPSAGPATAPALVGAGVEGPWGRTSGRLVVVSHNWSGVLGVHNIGRRYAIDLYSHVTRLALVDIVNEIMVDVTGLAAMRDGRLDLPELTAARLFSHIVDDDAWFRFLETDPEHRPSLLRRAIEAFRARPGEALKRRLVAALTPKLAARLAAPPAPAAPPPAAPPPPPSEESARLRDELRCLAAAVDGLARRALSQA